MKWKIGLLVIFLYAMDIWAEENWVTASGYADLSSGKIVARRQALVDAYRQAIDAGGLVEVGSYSQVSNFAMVSDVVNTRSTGYIKTYQLLNEGADTEDASLYKVTIKAQVVTGATDGDEQGLSAFVDLIGKPKVLFLLDKESGTDEQIKTSTAESYLAERFRKVGYQVQLADDINTRKVAPQTILSARQGNGAAAAELGRLQNADIVLTGSLKVQLTEMSGGTDVTAKLGNVNLAVRALIPGNGSVVDVKSSQGRFMSVQQDSELIATEKAIAKAVKKVAGELAYSIPNYLSKQPRSINLQVENLGFADLESFSDFLESISGVSGAEMLDWQDNIASFVVDSEYTGPKESDIANLLLSNYAGAKVKSFRNYNIALTL